jgi:hypothetical protein
LEIPFLDARGTAGKVKAVKPTRYQINMPPINASGLHLAPKATFNGNIPAIAIYRELCSGYIPSVLSTNTLVADDTWAQEVSWQSAYWPVMACALAVLLQETGRVAEQPFFFSYALRACPFVCVFDTLMMLLKFVAMLAVGCSPQTAVRHVWYDRFDEDRDSSSRKGFSEYLEDLREEHRSVSVAAENTIESVSSADLHRNPNPEEEYMCSGALPAVSDQESVLTDVPLATSRTPDDSFFSQPLHTTTSPSMDIAEELERPDGETSTQSLNDTSNTLPGQDQTIVDSTTTVAAPSSSPNAFMVTPNYMDAPPGSTVDRGWRLSIISFVLGAFPQAIKVFVMRGVPLTQTLVAIYVISFIVPEIFRSLAGPVGQSNLYPLPMVLNANSFFSQPLFISLFWASVLSYISMALFSALIALNLPQNHVTIVSVSTMLPFLVTLLLLKVLRFIFSSQIFGVRLKGISSRVYNLAMVQRVRTILLAFIAGSFALKPSTVEPYLSFACLYATSVPGIVWALLCILPFTVESQFVVFVAVVIVLTSYAFLLALVPYLVFRISFIDCLSNITHRLCGTKGTIEEFIRGMFILMNFATFTMSYTGLYISSDTFKPRWAEVLG